MDNTSTTALDFSLITQPWTAIPPHAQAKFTHWMDSDPTGQAVATEAEGDLDYALWLIAVELTCHLLLARPFTTLHTQHSPVPWRTLYDTNHTPAHAIHHVIHHTTDTPPEPQRL